ncbi:hypothetical protein BOX15_Mlig025109g2 [Macrostomum lignano]|uniref:Protein quiver n=1 Tax=Macrostomum lignano TaxID=282301 RepID=A0A267DYT4_9PLAT|nr:hypothetical protein BOX15_Mlig025109g2 [Macrostomum lignano]
MAVQRFAILIALMACFCYYASGLRCYICNSLNDKACDGDSLDKKFLINCSLGRNDGSGPSAFKPVPNAKVCWKQRQDVEGRIIVDRMCGQELESGNVNTCYDRVGTKKVKVRYCVCDKDECNGSGSVGGSSIGVALALLAAFLAAPWGL